MKFRHDEYLRNTARCLVDTKYYSVSLRQIESYLRINDIKLVKSKIQNLENYSIAIKDEKKKEDPYYYIPNHLKGIIKSQCELFDRNYKETKEIVKKIKNYSEISWKELLDNNPLLKNIEDLYTKLDCSKDSDNSDSLDLETELENFLIDKENKVFLILSNKGGSGKSIFLQILEGKMLNEWKNLSSWIPIYIPLNSLDDMNFIQDFIVKENKLGISHNEINILKDKRICFLLDGYDEINEIDEIDEKKWINLYQTNNIAHWENSKVIITSRTHKLPEDHTTSFTNSFAPSPRNKKSKGLLWRYTKPFTEEKVKEYLEKYIKQENRSNNNDDPQRWTVNDYLENITRISSISDLITIPIFLRMLAESLPKIYKENITTSDIYSKFIDSWFEREYYKKTEIYTKYSQNNKDILKKHQIL